MKFARDIIEVVEGTKPFKIEPLAERRIALAKKLPTPIGKQARPPSGPPE